MGILDNDSSSQPSAADVARERLLRTIRKTFNEMVTAYNDGSSLFWSNYMGASPEEVAVALGSDAREVFYLHGKLGELLESIKPEAIQQGKSIVGDFQINEDGSVTVIPPTPTPTATPEPTPYVPENPEELPPEPTPEPTPGS